MGDKIRMKLVEKPVNGATVFETTTNAPLIKGNGKADYICGMCKSVLAEGVELGQIKNVILRCYMCKRYNQC